MKIKLFFCSLFLSAALFSQAFFQQALSINFSSNHLVKAISPTSDGGCILALDDYINNLTSAVMKLDANGMLQWTYNISYDSAAYDLVFEIMECSAGGCFIVGESSTPSMEADYITKIDASGNFLWTKNFPVNYHLGDPGLRLSGNGDYVFSSSDIPNKIIHLDANGNILASSNYETDTVSVPATIPCVAFTVGSDGGPLLCGHDGGVTLTKIG